MADIETLRVSIEADPRSLDAAIKGIDRSITDLSEKLDKEFSTLKLRLGILSETISDFRSQTDGAANAVGRLIGGLGKLSGLPPVEVLGQVLGGAGGGRSSFESRFARRFGQDPAALRDEFLISNERIARLESVSEENRAIHGTNTEIAGIRAKLREIAGTLAAQASKLAADLRNATGSEPGLPDTAAVQELRREFDRLTAILEEIKKATSDPRIRSVIEGVRPRSNPAPGRIGALDIQPSMEGNISPLLGSLSGGEDVERLIGGGLDDLQQQTADSTEGLRTLTSATRDLGFTFASAFEDAVVEGRRLSDVLEGLERDILRILTRKLVTEPLAGALTGLIGSGVGTFAGTFHQGGKVGSTAVSSRVVPAALFAGAPRFAGGGMIGRVPRLAPGEVPAILHRGEVVRTPAQEAALRRNAGGSGATQIVVNIQTPDPRAFNESRGQIQAMLADAVRAGRRFR